MTRNDFDGPLRASIEGDELVIRIGIERLAACLQGDDGPLQGCVIDDELEAAEEIVMAMCSSDESGSTRLDKFLDEMAVAAVADGSIHIKPAGRD